jgi:CheY-like chemotaxis protein
VPHKNPLILIVEDRDDSREALKLLLEDWGATVETAVDGEEALRLASRIDFDVVVCDLKLPDIDGVNVGRYFVARKPKPYLIAYTAFYSRERDRARTKEAGFDAHVAKGPAPHELLRLLDQLKSRLPSGSGGDVPSAA